MMRNLTSRSKNTKIIKIICALVTWLYKLPSTQLCLQVNFHIFALLKYFLPPLTNILQRLNAYRTQAGDLRS